MVQIAPNPVENFAKNVLFFEGRGRSYLWQVKGTWRKYYFIFPLFKFLQHVKICRTQSVVQKTHPV